jgi:uncharacterized protein (TIGR02217 family)
MAFIYDDVVFPIDISLQPVGGPEYETDLTEPDSGLDYAQQNRVRPKIRLRVGLDVKKTDEVGEFIKFFRGRRGRFRAFPVLDWSDYKSNHDMAVAVTNLDQVIGQGDGATVDFQLIKTYDDAVNPEIRTITKPIPGTIVVAVDGSPATITVDDQTGIVTITSGAPGSGDQVTAGFHYYTPMRFLSDLSNIRMIEPTIGGIIDIELREVFTS